MTPRHYLATLLLLLSPMAALPAEEKPTAFTIILDTSAAPECQAFADKAKALCEEWYPKINALLFGDKRPLPSREVTLVFKPMDGVAGASGARIEISAEWVTKKAPDDYGMVIHELTHVVQDYKGKGTFWLTEGIADYMRDRHFEPGQRPFRLNPIRSHYKQGYNTAGAFLIWLEANKDKEIVAKLNQASHDGKYEDALFENLAGKKLDELWQEFSAHCVATQK